MAERLDDKINRMLVNFARRHPRIESIYRGHFSRDRSSKEIYFIVVDSYNFNRYFEDRITNLDMRISKKTRKNISVMCLPLGIKGATKYSFLETEIYKKSQK